MNPWWLWGSLAGTVILGGILAASIVHLVQAYRASEEEIITIPLAREQHLILDTTGSMLLHLEGPLLTQAFANLEFRMIHRHTHTNIPLSTVFFRSSKAGFSKARISFKQFSVTTPGPYVLEVIGLEPSLDIQGHHLVITKDLRMSFTPKVIGIVISAMSFLGCLGLFIAAMISRMR